MKALTLVRPWGWAIAQGFKDIENRVWAPPPGVHRFAIHAGQGYDRSAWHLPAFRSVLDATTDESWDLAGAIIGLAILRGAHQHGHCTPGDSRCLAWGRPASDRPMWHWEVDGQPLAEPVPCPGRLGLWHLPERVEAAVLAQLPGVHA
jgi:hypothetical protein